MRNVVENILCSTGRVSLDFSGDGLHDALCFGFSYMESEDHMVNYIAANGRVMKNILLLPEAVLNPDQESIGELWTAKLLVSNKLNDRRILLSNDEFSTIINLNLNPNKETEHADL